MDGMDRAEEVLGDELDAILGEEEEDQPLEADEGDDAPEDDEAAEDDAAEGEDGEEEPEATAEPVKAPVSWSKEDAEVFAKLDPAAQAIIQRRESERDRYVQQKSVEAAQTRDRVANEARDIIVKMHEDHAQRLELYARQILPQRPDERLLYSGNPDDVIIYQRQMAAYERSAGQQQELHQQIAQAQAAAQSAREQSQQAERQMDAQRLREQLPEWDDPSAGPQLRSSLKTIGAELGYPDELMAEASSTDILALKKALEWKTKADRYDQAMGKKMETVRAAKGLPKMAKPGVKPSKQHQNAVQRQKAWDRVKSTNAKDGNAIADWLGLEA